MTPVPTWTSLAMTLGLLGVLAVGCGPKDPDGLRDAGGTDTRPEPTGDAGLTDVGEVDLGSEDAGRGDAGGTNVPPICTAGARWTTGTPTFREVTDAFGLTGVEGTRISAADFDDDGWIDVIVRRANNNGDDFAPGGLRRSWLLRNTGQGRFEDRTMASGIWQTRNNQGSLGRPGQVVVFGDADNDGDLDAYTGMGTNVEGAMPGETSELMFNDGAGGFTLGPADDPIRRAGDVDAVAGAAFVDFDRDGTLDLWIGEHNYTPLGTQNTVFLGDHLYRGGPRFVEVSAEVGLFTVDWIDVPDLNRAAAHSRAWSAAACDLNNDGTTELLVASYGRAPNHLWQGLRQGDGRVSFMNRSVESGYAFDANQEWSDNEFARCYCQANRQADGCSTVPVPQIACSSPNWNHSLDREPFRLGGNSGTTVCADLNNDGHLDLFTTEITHWWAGSGADRSEILFNSGDADTRFLRPGSDATGLLRNNPAANWDNGDMTAAVFDFDNDGWPDIYVGASDYPGNRGLLFHQVAAGRFEPVSVTDGFDHPRSHGVVTADFDRDGDLDVLVGHSRSRCQGASDCRPTEQVRLFENVLGQAGNWLQLDLEGGSGTNRSAIGARVTVRTSDAMQTQEVGGGHGHYGTQQDHVLHFGLGSQCEAEVEVRWPDASLTTQSLRLPAGHRFRLVQGSTPELVEPR